MSSFKRVRISNILALTDNLKDRERSERRTRNFLVRRTDWRSEFALNGGDDRFSNNCRVSVDERERMNEKRDSNKKDDDRVIFVITSNIWLEVYYYNSDDMWMSISHCLFIRKKRQKKKIQNRATRFWNVSHSMKRKQILLMSIADAAKSIARMKTTKWLNESCSVKRMRSDWLKNIAQKNILLF